MEGLFILGIMLALYFLPAIVAAAREKRDTGAILVLNLLLGWTLVGWVVALVWAVTHDARPRRRSRTVTFPKART